MFYLKREEDVGSEEETDEEEEEQEEENKDQKESVDESNDEHELVGEDEELESDECREDSVSGLNKEAEKKKQRLFDKYRSSPGKRDYFIHNYHFLFAQSSAHCLHALV